MIDKRDNIIVLSDYTRSIKSLDDAPYFENYLSALLDAIANKDDAQHLIDWWKSNQSRVTSDTPLLLLANFIGSLSFTYTKKDEGSLKEQEIKIEEVPSNPEVEEAANKLHVALENSIARSKHLREYSKRRFGFASFERAADFLLTTREHDVISHEKEYFDAFSPHDPLFTLAKTLKLYFPNENSDRDDEAILEAASKMPSIGYESELCDFLGTLADWAVRSDSSHCDALPIFNAVLSCELLSDYDRIDSRRELLEIALHSPYAIFELFMMHFMFGHVAELLPVLQLPFVHKPQAGDKPALNDFVLNQLEIGCNPVDRDGVSNVDIENTYTRFYKRYSSYRKKYFDGASPISMSNHWDLVDVTTNYAILGSPPGLSDLSYFQSKLGADFSVIWALYLVWSGCEEDIFFEVPYGLPANPEAVSGQVIETLFKSLTDEYQYDAAVAFLSAVIFKAAISNNGSLESYPCLYSLIERANVLPAKNIVELEKAIKFTEDTAKDHGKVITANRIARFMNTEISKWEELVSGGESQTCEFKSTLRWNIERGCADKAIEYAVLKTVSAFLNTSGGFLFIGVSDDGEIIGTQLDRFKSSDKFQLKFTNMLRKLDGSIDGHFISSMNIINGKDVFVVECDKAKKPVYLEGKLYIRRGPSTIELSLPGAVSYIEQRFI